MKIVLATANKDKVREMRHALDGLDVEILTRDEFPGIPDVIEDGATLEDNARKKALAICEATGLPSVADDTGLEVDALFGAPGVYSSRFSGQDATYADNVRELIRKLDGVPEDKRGARFRCVLALIEPSGVEVLVEGVCEGTILTESRGAGGFGYDPVFFVPSRGATFAEMSLAEKNEIGHRGKALARMRRVLKERFLLA